MRPVAPSAAQESDPLLKLVRNDPGELKSDDDLLPAFLRNRSDEDSQEPSSFIPDLPDSVDSGLKILPFGAMPKKEQDDEPGTFIPRMPD